MQSYILTKPRLKERTADISGFSAEMTFISASAVPNKDEPGKSIRLTFTRRKETIYHQLEVVTSVSKASVHCPLPVKKKTKTFRRSQIL